MTTITPVITNKLLVRVEGITPLVLHRFSEKTCTPQRYEDSHYELPDGSHGIPAYGFKAGIINASRMFPHDNISMTALKGTIHIESTGPNQLIKLISSEPTVHEQRMVCGESSRILRLPQYDNWAAEFVIDYYQNLVTEEYLKLLVNAAGIGGIGQHRPSTPKSPLTDPEAHARYNTYGQFKLMEGMEQQ